MTAPGTIRAEILGMGGARVLADPPWFAETVEASGHSPVLQLCHTLVSHGIPASTPLDAYRGDVLCLRIGAIGAAAGLTVEDSRYGRPVFRRRREREAA